MVFVMFLDSLGAKQLHVFFFIFFHINMAKAAPSGKMSLQTAPKKDE